MLYSRALPGTSSFLQWHEMNEQSSPKSSLPSASQPAKVKRTKIRDVVSSVTSRWPFWSTFVVIGLLVMSVARLLPLAIAIVAFFAYGVVLVFDEGQRFRQPNRPEPKVTNAVANQILFAAFVYYFAVNVYQTRAQHLALISLFAIAIVSTLIFRLAPLEPGQTLARKPGAVWFYLGLAFLFFAVCAVGLDMSLGNRYSTRWGINTRVLLLFLMLEGTLLLTGSVLAFFEKPNIDSKSVIFSKDILLTFLVNRCGLGPVRAGLTFLIAFTIPLFAWCQHQGRLLAEPGGRSGLIDFAGSVAGYFFVVPAVMAFNVYLSQLFENALTVTDTIPPASRKELMSWLHRERAKPKTRFILAVVTAASMSAYRLSLILYRGDSKFYWMEDRPHHVDTLYLFAFEWLCACIGFFIVCSALGDGLIILRFIRELGSEKLTLNAFHADGAWGLSKLGQCSLVVSLMNLIALIVPVLFWRDASHFEQAYSKLVAGLLLPLALSTCAAMLFFAFVGALWPLHKQMRTRKDNLLSAYSDFLAPSRWPIRTSSPETVPNQLSSIFHLRQELQKCPTWPYSARGVLRFVSTYVLPVLGLTGASAKLAKFLPELIARLVT